MNAGIQCININAGKRRECAASVTNLAALGVQQSGAERLHHPGTAIIGGAAADTNDDMADALIQRMPDQLAGAE